MPALRYPSFRKAAVAVAPVVAPAASNAGELASQQLLVPALLQSRSPKCTTPPWPSARICNSMGAVVEILSYTRVVAERGGPPCGRCGRRLVRVSAARDFMPGRRRQPRP